MCMNKQLARALTISGVTVLAICIVGLLMMLFYVIYMIVSDPTAPIEVRLMFALVGIGLIDVIIIIKCVDINDL